MSRTESDYLDITVDAARTQWRELLARQLPPAGKRQVSFIPIETLLSLAASFVVNRRQFGGKNMHLVPAPIPQLSELFKRSPGSILEKVGNLDGTRPNGARLDLITGTRLRADTALLSSVYRTIFAAARAEGIDQAKLPDFLAAETGVDLDLLGQDTLPTSQIEEDIERRSSEWASAIPDLSAAETERLLIATARVGQHRFAVNVLANCHGACVFCGMTSPAKPGPSLLIASHIKPWRDSADTERLDHRNGVAACPTHDRAFDVGLLTLTVDLQIQLAPSLATHISRDPSAYAAFGSPPLRSQVDLAQMASTPQKKYTSWHRENIYIS